MDRLRGKSVALVGAADSITGSGAGSEIDMFHDYVVRINNGFIYPEEMSEDLGDRADFVYHTGVLNTSDGTGEGLRPVDNHNEVGVRNLRTADLDVMEQLGVQCLVLVVGPGSRRMSYLRSLPNETLRWTRFPRDYRSDLQRHMGSLPNTGVLAAWHLLRSDLERLDLYGFDFFTTPHFSGYNGETEEYRLTAGQRPTDRPHDQVAQVNLIGEFWARDHRLNLPPAAEQKVREAGWMRQ